MQVILIDDVFDLGRRGDIVRVADGYGRNYLIPKRLAIPATSGNVKMVEQQRVALAKKEAKFKEEAEILAGELEQQHVVLSRKAGETGVLFGSVTAKDLIEVLQTEGFHVDRRKVTLAQPIKKIGNYTVDIHPHTDVIASILVSVPPEDEEAVARVHKKGDKDSQAAIKLIEGKLEEIARLAPAEASDEEGAESAPQKSEAETAPPASETEGEG